MIPTKSILDLDENKLAVSENGNTSSRDKTWVTCFGFPPGLSEAMVSHFANVKGLAVVDYSPKRDAQSNWVHLKLQSQKDVAVALGESNKVVAINDLKVMIGVKLFPEGDQIPVSGQVSAGNAHTSKPGRGGDTPQRANSLWERMAVWVMDF